MNDILAGFSVWGSNEVPSQTETAPPLASKCNTSMKTPWL